MLLRCNFKFQVFTAPGAGFCIPLLLRCGTGPPQKKFRGGFSIRGGPSLGQTLIIKIINFLMIFLSFVGIFILCCFMIV